MQDRLSWFISRYNSKYLLTCGDIASLQKGHEFRHQKKKTSVHTCPQPPEQLKRWDCNPLSFFQAAFPHVRK